MMNRGLFPLIALMTSLTVYHVQAFSLSMSSTNKVTIIAGATGYIGKSVVRESVRQGYKTIALVRNSKKVQSVEGQRLYGEFFEGAQVVECDVSDPNQLSKVCIYKREKALSARHI